MNLTKLQRGIEHLAVLLEIRGDREEKRREEELRLRLLAVLALVLANEDYRAFEASFLSELEDSYYLLDTSDEFGDLIDKEIANQRGYLHGFIEDMKNDELSEAQAKHRAGMYAGSLGSFRERLNLEREGDNRLTWRYDDSIEEERHCRDCKDLDGQTRTGHEWATLNLHPKSILLQCSYNCRCTLG